ncbi:MAG TPA: DNA polymerase/3'-5' exonuclease PolX [Candidatus Bathyarchaeia archaeon]|nr:DNA polymerase/3'-5' exonuclease PolX [Candidatus Bathyarchaeia archaeon]
MKSFEIARLFEQMADALELQGGNPFRVRAYRRAAQNLETLSEDVEVLARAGRLEEIPGIGADLAGKIDEYLRTGHIAEIETSCRRVPRGVMEMLAVPGIGPKTARQLYEREGVTSVAQLERLAAAGKLRGRHGIQARTEQNIVRGVQLLRRGQARMQLGRALPLGRDLVRALEDVRGVKTVMLAGSLRRMKETVGDIDVLAASSEPAAIIKAFTGLRQVAEVLERGTTKAAIRHREGIQVDLRVVDPESMGAALAYFTGSKQHNIRLREMAVKRGLKISEYGVFRGRGSQRIAGASEEEVYAAVGLPWIPPELRENTGEIEAAQARRLPALVTLDDVRGDLHCHTDATDGHHSIEALVAAAASRGYAYVAVTDHSRATRVAGGLDIDELRAHVGRIRAVARRHPRIAVLAGSECDILPDGRLDYPDEVLAELDLVIASVHTRFKQPKREMTRRICTALANPHVHILGHPTGRLLGERDPYALDLDEVLRAAKRHGKALEINAYPDRLDLCDTHARRARDLGVLLALGTDTHMLDHLGYMELGVATARRGWVGASQIVNTWPLEKLRSWRQPAG